ncbi:hypothetical protein [Aquimarina megaterium]|uniref:hypothetical protein n=1 Tax=Aquimarina megaterium TaxID=1443666 RepID=UPI00046E9D9C|nr:hypothetical protein [Aquimarina megaterium]
MIKNDWIIAGVGISIGIIAVYLVKNKIRNPKMVSHPIEPSLEATKKEIKQDEPCLIKRQEMEKIAPEVTTKKPWLLTKGSTGKEVERLQIWLLRHHGWKGVITKVFDEQTEQLVKKIFKKEGVDKVTYDKHQMGTPIHELIKA